MAEVTLIDLEYCKVESFSFSMTDPSLESLFENWGPTSVKDERASLLRYEKSISVTSAILISKVPTSSGLIDTHTHAQCSNTSVTALCVYLSDYAGMTTMDSPASSWFNDCEAYPMPL